ncbi:MAG: gliding motility lipoprotein GldH [Prevotella sp.]|nr:gliding motility lipoprotein GldH [Prevotella sp.]
MQTTRIRHYLHTIITGLSAVLLTACFPDTHYVTYQHVDADGWERDSVLEYTIPHVDDDGTYMSEIDLRTTRAYPFTRLYLIVSQTIYPAGRTITDTLNLEISDNQGRQKGRGFTLLQQERPFRFLQLHQGDSLVIHVSHHMRRRLLSGISDVGYRLVHND